MLAKSILWFFLLLTLAPAAQSQNRAHHGTHEQFSLRGTVKSQNESPIGQARVELRRVTGEIVGLAITREDGRFDFSLLAAGEYVLSVTCSGFDVARENVDLHFAELQNYSLYVRRDSRLSDVPATPTVSVRELRLPFKATSAFRKGTEMLYQKHDVEASIRQFQEAVRHYSDYYEAYFQLGVAYGQMRRLDEAASAFEKAIELSSHRYAPALIGLAAIANERREFQQAAELAKRGVDLDDALWQGHLELARASLGLGNLQSAEKSLNDTRNRNSQWPALYLLFANLHIRQENPRAVQADLEEYLRLEPNGPSSARARELLEQISASLAQSQPQAGPNSDKP